MKKIMLILAIVALFAGIIIWFVIKRERSLNESFNQQYFDSRQEQNQDGTVDSRTQFIEDIAGNKELVGVINTAYDPKEKKVRFFKIETDIVNIDELDGVDFSRKAPQLPMTKQTFQVAVDDSTKLVGIASRDDIESGDMVRVRSGASIYELTEFTAQEIEVVAKRR